MTYLWDFYGPDAEGTAEHFVQHLDDFLARHALVGCPTGVETYEPGHAAAFCTAPAEHHTLIFSALKPKRGRRDA